MPLQLWHPWPLTLSHSHLPLPQTHTDTVSQCMVHINFNHPVCYHHIQCHEKGCVLKGNLAISIWVTHILIFFCPINLLSSHIHFHWVFCQIWGIGQGQIHPHGPQLALTPVTRVCGRGRHFHAGCTICPVFTLLSICITDSRPEWHQHEATVTERYCFFGGMGYPWNCLPDSAKMHDFTTCVQSIFVLWEPFIDDIYSPTLTITPTLHAQQL